MAKDIITQTLDAIEMRVKYLESELGTVAQPIHKSILKRFPILFALLVTFGVASIFFGFERLLSETFFINNHPLLMVALGVCVLVLTGQLYKKL